MLLLLDPKTVSHVTSHHLKPCPTGAVWSFEMSLTSQRGHFLHLWQVNILSRALCVRENPCCTFSICFHVWPMPIMKPPKPSDDAQDGRFTARGYSAIWALVFFSIPDAPQSCYSCCSEGLLKLDIRFAGRVGISLAGTRAGEGQSLSIQETHKASIYPSSVGSQADALNLCGFYCLFSWLLLSLWLKRSPSGSEWKAFIARTQESLSQPLSSLSLPCPSLTALIILL